MGRDGLWGEKGMNRFLTCSGTGFNFVLTPFILTPFILVPMAIPSFGGMIIAMLTVFVVPVLYCWVEERRVKAR
ncbi:MAG: hypothetical protein D3909_02170 [Candidatus Electrothrix sp. ATG1]|nr:hypothetical protein [Candidatus Electrothrix sp. ATG1]